ncbi:TRAP transporter small permease [Aeromicrobium sp. YIM 150415]|uniref:TRAP transporter small permease n=1 Tax=Aeromicrobium sp. YIM 150415 TaxID=2803912 RepID=UPI001962398D|nr:TRAP transporter small permease [Aeromicrobium sp. YIM 150415]MBM9461822.1 TRAP transporter small permease [Aeromicrobium sp. YIM 150415]MBM9463170.1 TRAP transporter small permease [Aeromicrobium sp. YIM 150415]
MNPRPEESPSPAATKRSPLRWISVLTDGTGYLSAIALIVATGAVLHGVIMRYFFKAPTLWQTEAATYLLILVAFIGSAYGLKHRAHVGVDLFVELLEPRKRLIARVTTAVLSVAVIAIVAVTATSMWWHAAANGHHATTSWGPPLGVVYAILPLGMLLLALEYVRQIVDAIDCLRRGEPEAAELVRRSAGH